MKTTMKFFAFSLFISMVMFSCSNPVGANGKSDGVSVDVSVDGIADGGRGLFADTNVILVQVQAKNASSVEVGTGTMTKGATAYTGSLTLSEVGALTFTAVAMNASGEMLYFGMLPTTVVDGGSITITAGSWSVDWMNLQAVSQASINPGETFDVYGQIYKATVTDTSATASPFLTYDVGISSANTDPATWASELWTAATFNIKTGSNHEYKLIGTGASLAEGTYYIATRAKLTGGKYSYGANGGIWNGTTINSTQLVVATIPSVLKTIHVKVDNASWAVISLWRFTPSNWKDGSGNAFPAQGSWPNDLVKTVATDADVNGYVSYAVTAKGSNGFLFNNNIGTGTLQTGNLDREWNTSTDWYAIINSTTKAVTWSATP